MSGTNPKEFGFTDLHLGLAATVDFVVTAEDMASFASLSGDRNPLHLDDVFAQKKGYRGSVVYGALLIGKVSQLIGMELPGRDSVWMSVDMQFNKPLYVGQPAQATGTVDGLSESTQTVELKLAIRASGETLARGRAEILIVR
jgi:acyl dehydratase